MSLQQGPWGIDLDGDGFWDVAKYFSAGASSPKASLSPARGEGQCLSRLHHAMPPELFLSLEVGLFLAHGPNCVTKDVSQSKTPGRRGLHQEEVPRQGTLHQCSSRGWEEQLSPSCPSKTGLPYSEGGAPERTCQGSRG